MELIDYENFVNTLFVSRQNRMFLNSDANCALVVLKNIFINSNENIRIFAGDLCNDITNNEEYIKTLSDFIERGGAIRILLNKYNREQAKTSNLFKRLSYYVNKGKNIQIKSTNESPYRVNDSNKTPVHFTIGDNVSYRIETDVDNYAAECNSNNPNVADGLCKFYDNIFDSPNSVEINITELFC